jgi:hypothetical protein
MEKEEKEKEDRQTMEGWWKRAVQCSAVQCSAVQCSAVYREGGRSLPVVSIVFRHDDLAVGGEHLPLVEHCSAVQCSAVQCSGQLVSW